LRGFQASPRSGHGGGGNEGTDLLAVEDHELVLSLECVRELGVLSLYEHEAVVAIGRVEQSKIDLAEYSH
jgi:hypothetical protein